MRNFRMILMLVAGAMTLGTSASAESVPTSTVPGPQRAHRSAMASHQGLLLGISLGGGAMISNLCEQCRSAKGIAIDNSVGWFLSPRFALMYDMTGVVTASFAVAGAHILQSAALQYWPHEDFWLKGGIGVAKLLVATPVGEGKTSGGGMTLAAGYEFHHSGSYATDMQLRFAHGSFDGAEGESIEVDSMNILLGFNWY
jgi:hypothetical protein